MNKLFLKFKVKKIYPRINILKVEYLKLDEERGHVIQGVGCSLVLVLQVGGELEVEQLLQCLPVRQELAEQSNKKLKLEKKLVNFKIVILEAKNSS